MSFGIGHIHLFSATLALLAGGFVVLRPKGVGLHKWVGRVYFWSMVVMLLTAMSIYRLFGGFGPFHAAAIVSGISVLAGYFAAWRRAPRGSWIAHHAFWMSWSYVGLWAAAVSEISTRYLDLHFGATVGVATFVVIFVGWLAIRLRMPGILQRFGL